MTIYNDKEHFDPQRFMLDYKSWTESEIMELSSHTVSTMSALAKPSTGRRDLPM